MTARTPAAGHDDRAEVVRGLERRRVQAELRSRLFGAASDPVRVERFEIRRKLGEGAMGVVYAAFDPRLQREVALKLLTALPRGGEDGVLGEARALARLAHPNVLAVHEAGMHEGVAYLVSELVVGGTLRAWLAASPRTAAAVLALLIEVGRGVSAAHQRGLVHRDLKPENILVGSDGRPRVADFGLAQPADRAAMAASPRGASSSPLPGTLAYMAPEQLRGERADPRSDQFSFCVLAFEALFGRHPFDASTPAELLAVMERAAIAPVPPAHPSLRVLPALRRGLQPEAEARWPSFLELLAALAAPAGRKVPIASLALGALAAVGLVGAGAGAWIQITERDLAHEVIALTEQRRYAECADLLEKGAIEDGLLHSWIGCVQASGDEGRLDRACDAWPSRTRATPPDVCAPVPRAARRLFVAGKYRECAEAVLAAPPTAAGSVALARCLAPLRDAALYRRQCHYQVAMRAPGGPPVDCGAGVLQVAPR